MGRGPFDNLPSHFGILLWQYQTEQIIHNYTFTFEGILSEALKLNSGKPVSHCLPSFVFNLIRVMLGGSSVNLLSKQLVSLSLLNLGTKGGVTFPWRQNFFSQSLNKDSQEPAQMRSSLCHGSRSAPSLVWLHRLSQSYTWGPEHIGFDLRQYIKGKSGINSTMHGNSFLCRILATIQKLNFYQQLLITISLF